MDDEELTKQLLNEFNNSIENRIENVIYDDERDENSDYELNRQNGPISLNFEWIEGLRTGSRLVWVPSEDGLYYSNAINKKNSAIACTCFIKHCKERILILDDGTATRENLSTNHTHGSLYHVFKERFLFAFMKERCRTAPASALIRDVYNEAVVKYNE